MSDDLFILFERYIHMGSCWCQGRNVAVMGSHVVVLYAGLFSCPLICHTCICGEITPI